MFQKNENRIIQRGFLVDFPFINLKPLNILCFRDLRSEVGGNCALWTPVWEQACPYAGRAVCGFHSAVGPSGGGSVQAARTGQPGQRAAGCLRLWRETLFWLVRSVWLLRFPQCMLMWRWYLQTGQVLHLWNHMGAPCWPGTNVPRSLQKETLIKTLC